MESACELAVYLAMIEPPPCVSADAGLAEVMARLQPTDYLFAKRTLDALALADDAATLKKCLLTALWGNPFAMTSLQFHFLKASAGVPRPPDDLYCYWAVRRAATGINQLVRLELPERMHIISHAYCSRDAESTSSPDRAGVYHLRRGVEEICGFCYNMRRWTSRATRKSPPTELHQKR